MKVEADLGKCQGYGTCALVEPKAFDLNDEGLVVLLMEEPPEELRDSVRQAVRDCPTQALRLEE